MKAHIPGINTVTAKGRTYHYHRETGTRLTGEYGSVEFMRQVEALNAGKQLDGPKPSDGTFGAMFAEYRASPEFTQLSLRTKADYLDIIDYLKPLAGVLVSSVDEQRVLKIRDKAFDKRKRRFANYVLQFLSMVYGWGKPRGYCKFNPARDVPKIKKAHGAKKVNRAWHDHERIAMLANATPQVKLCIALCMFAALREGDAVRIKTKFYDGRSIDIDQGKTGNPLSLPVHRELKVILDAELARLPRTPEAPLLLNRSGRAFTESGVRSSFFKLVRRMEQAGKVQPGLSLHGLRHTVGKTLAEAGASTKTIAAVLGHKSERMAEHYSREADRKRLAHSGIEILQNSGYGSAKQGNED